MGEVCPIISLIVANLALLCLIGMPVRSSETGREEESLSHELNRRPDESLDRMLDEAGDRGGLHGPRVVVPEEIHVSWYY